MDVFNNMTSSVTNWWGKGPGGAGKKGEEGDKKELKLEGDEGQSPPSAASGNDDGKGTAAAAASDRSSAGLGNVSPTGSEKSPPTSEADNASMGSQPEDLPADATAGGDVMNGKENSNAKGAGFGGIAVDIEEVSTKALQSAKTFGNFLFSVGKKAGKTVTDTAKHLKHTVEENSILGEFNKEQEAFLQEKEQQRVEAAVPPWVGYSEEEAMKQQILALSMDRRNFVRSPPSGVSFQFDNDAMHPVAEATLAEDENLQKMRFELVPKTISEENFWRNYFYRVSLIKQSTQLSSLAQETGSTGGEDSSKSSRKSSVDDDKDTRHLARSAEEGDSASAKRDNLPSADTPTSLLPSDAYHSTPAPISKDNISQGMKQLGVDQRVPVKKENDDEWEKELQQELQDYEVVTEGGGQTNPDDSEWEKEIQSYLAAEDSRNKNKA